MSDRIPEYGYRIAGIGYQVRLVRVWMPWPPLRFLPLFHFRRLSLELRQGHRAVMLPWAELRGDVTVLWGLARAGTCHVLPPRGDNPRPNLFHIGIHSLFLSNLCLAIEELFSGIQLFGR